MISVKKGGLASSIPKNIRQNRTSKLKKKKKDGILWQSVVRTLHFHFRRCRLDPWLGS